MAAAAEEQKMNSTVKEAAVNMIAAIKSAAVKLAAIMLTAKIPAAKMPAVIKIIMMPAIKQRIRATLETSSPKAVRKLKI